MNNISTAQDDEPPGGSKGNHLKEFRSAGGNLYYSIPYVHNPNGLDPDKQYAWIQGAHLYAASKRASGQ